MVKCNSCNKPIKKYWRKFVKDEDECVVYCWMCPFCGSVRQTKRRGKTYRYYVDKEFREAENKRKREYMREKRSKEE